MTGGRIGPVQLAWAITTSLAVMSGIDLAQGTPAQRSDAEESRTAPAPATRLDALSSESMPAGFARALTVRQFEFPRDHGPHPDYRHEWWYVTGHLDAETGEHFGFELTFFRFALAPPSSVAAAPDTPRSAWRTREIYMAHFAITDLDRKRFYASERYARDALGLSGARAEPFRVWLEDWSLGMPEQSDTTGDTEGAERSANASSRMTAAMAPAWQLHAADHGYVLDLTLKPLTPPILNGDAGLSRKSDAPGAASYYYSIPRIAVSGRVLRDGEPLEVHGLAWLDREWGSGTLGPDQQGWDWFALQLDDGSALMFYALRKKNGSRDPHSAGTWLAPDGSARPLANADVQIDVKDYWTSPHGGRYPARWQLRVPSLALDVDIRPRLADQELDTNPPYWEGAATISGTRADRKVTGRAYVELVGYSSRGSAHERK